MSLLVLPYPCTIYSEVLKNNYSEMLKNNFSEIKAKSETYSQSFFNNRIYKQLETKILTLEQYHQFLIDQHEICIALEKNMLKCINENHSFLSLYKYKKIYDLKKDLSFFDDSKKDFLFFECPRKASQAALNYVKHLKFLRKHGEIQQSMGNYYAKFFIDLYMNATFKTNLTKNYPRNFLTFENDAEKEIKLFDQRFVKISIDICEQPFLKGCEEAFGYLENVLKATLEAK